ncbi:phage replisome organizer N-terminal domain-containing protein [Streptococcus sp. NLN64]|uniref:phage replisome organizer N-terminal domain-containing protein n=1 Tax=Streptococcus sp. NLN64 TaxID=2822799 RepID=UPI0018C9D512|nr:phage replisome organizer N-terminal domain-containing protein [Streptococcus sp. NLN64]MBG9368191.1 phage replisome organizer N-terminal domain-containing protein [Streptococcus sp. NLN64]
MARTKVYFWLKIDKNFFSNIAIKRLRRTENGDAMTVLYIRMLLESTEDEGVLYFEGILSDLMEEVAEVLDADTELVRATFAYFEKAKLIQIDGDGNAELAQFPELVGSETEDARKKRRQRTRQKKNETSNEDEKGDIVPTLSQSVPDLSQSVPTEEKRRVREEIEKSQRQNRDFSDLEKNLSPEEVEQLNDNQNQTATADLTEKEIQDISNYYQSRIGPLDGYHHTQLIEFLTIDKMEPELLKRAIDKSADNSKRNFGYVRAILKNWAQNGIKTIAQQDEEERNYTASKSKGTVATESNSIFPDDIGF